MPIDFHRKSDYRYEELLFRLSDEAVEKLDEHLAEFEHKTGTFLDPYGKTVLSMWQIDNLAISVGSHEPDLSKFLGSLQSVDFPIVALGD